MKLSAIEKQVVANIHGLPLDKQQSVLEYSLFLINKAQKDKQENIEKNSASFAVFLKEFLEEGELEPLDIEENVKSSSAGTALKIFLKKYESDPIDIDTGIFEQDREIETDRDFKL